MPAGPFLIDHDQKFQQTAQVQYSFDQFNSFRKLAPFVAFTYRYDSGLVSGAVPDYATALGFSADQQQQIGLFCDSQMATLNNPITSCSDPNRGALRIRIPADGTASDDKNPPRVAPRNLFDLNFGSDNMLGIERVKLTGRFSIVNSGNKVALYNFESTFSGTLFRYAASDSGSGRHHFLKKSEGYALKKKSDKFVALLFFWQPPNNFTAAAKMKRF